MNNIATKPSIYIKMNIDWLTDLRFDGRVNPLRSFQASQFT